MFRAGMIKILLQQYRGKSGRAADITGTTEFDPKATLGAFMAANRALNTSCARIAFPDFCKMTRPDFLS
jgi:hypothetical protein